MSNKTTIGKDKTFKARVATYSNLGVSEGERVNGCGTKYTVSGNDGANDVAATITIYDNGTFQIQGSNQGNLPIIFADLTKA